MNVRLQRYKKQENRKIKLEAHVTGEHKKCAPTTFEAHFPSAAPEARRLSEAAGVAHQAALEVGSFVFVPGASLGQAVNHAEHLGQKLLGGFFVRHGAQVFNGGTGRFLVETIAQLAQQVLADAFFSRFVVCHLLTKFYCSMTVFPNEAQS
jgi:hypothetical protein